MPKFNISSLAQYVVRNPFTTTAAVFTPLFAKNEDRGYFRTALITAPIIFATGEFVPKMFGGVRDLAKSAVEVRNLIQKSEKWTRFEQTNFNDISTLFKDPNASQETRDRALSAYLVTERRSRDFPKEQKTLDKYFKRRFVKTEDLIGKANMGDLEAAARVAEIEQLHATKGRLVTNALHVARRSSLTPIEWASEIEGRLPDLDNDQMLAMYDQYKDREPFVRTLKNRLKEIKDLEYRGTLSEASRAPLEKVTSTVSLDFDNFFQEENMLQTQAPGVFENLAKAKRQNFIQQIIIEAERVTSGEIGKVLNVKVTRRGNVKPLVIPIVDPATGQVRLNDNAVGVGNYVIGPDKKPYRIDEWVSKMMVEQPGFTDKQLQEEIAAHAYWFAGDPLDARRMGELESFGSEGMSTLNSQAIKLRSYGAGITKLPLFGEGTTYEKFTAGEKVDFIRDLMNTNRYIGMGSEAGVYEGRWQLREAANLSPFGAPSAEKQDPIWRSITKEFRLTAPEGLPSEAVPNWRSNAWEALTGSADLPGAKFTVAGLSPQDRTLFSELPKTLSELHFDRSNIVQKFIERGMDTHQAAGMFNDLEQMYSEGKQGALSYLGGMGETGFVMESSFANALQVEGVSKYNVDELGVNKGDVLESNNVIGFNRGERVLPKFDGTVTDIAKAEAGFVVNIKHQLTMQGAKLDIAGIKGMNRVTETNEHFSQLRDLMNNFYQRMGTGDHISSNVNVLAPAEYFTNKVEPAHAYLGIASDLVNRLDAQGASSVSANYLSKMAAEGVNFQAGQLVIDAASNPVRDREAADRLRRLSEINEDFFKQAGDAIRSAGGYQDPVLNAFVHSGKDLGNYMLKNQLPAMGFAWDHSKVNVPRFSSISYDIETYMGLGHHFAGLKAMRSRMQTVSGGDPNQAIDFMKYVMGGDYSKEMGLTIPLKEAFSSRGALSRAGDRAGTIFDPSIDAYKKNFRIDLGNGRFLPVPGSEAYGAEADLFDPGKYQTRPWQNAIRDMAFEKDPEKRLGLENQVLAEYKAQFGVGKGSALRPYQYDPLGVPGFLSTAAEQGDPFVARVSEDWVKRVHSKRLRKAFGEGHDVIGLIQRQPTNELLYMKYRLDKSLNGTYDVAVPESVSRTLMGDQDKDLINSILIDANVRVEKGKMIVAGAANQTEREAAEEGILAMETQAKQLKIWQDIKGVDEIARMNVNFELTSLAEKNEKFATAISRRVGTAVNRTAGAAIGSYSNVLTKMVEHMVRNPKLMSDPDMVQRLKTGLFDIRQAPISARKAHTSFSLETAMQKIDLLRKGLEDQNPMSSAEKVNATLLSMAKTLSPQRENGPEYKYWATQGAEDLKVWAAGRSEKARLMAEVFTASKENKFAIENLLPEVFQDVESIRGPIHGGRIATESASRLGMVSEGIAGIGRDAAEAATGRAAKIFAKHGGAMAVGLGALAAMSISLTSHTPPTASFSRSSGNKFRPEERMGVADNIPGEPVAGQMAPSAPPRRMVSGQPGVKTAVVAPMAQTSDLSVRMRAVDASRAAETARQISQIPNGGDTNVTVNYRDRTKLRSLRTRERIRDIR